jgi:uncharacterized protein YhaN
VKINEVQIDRYGPLPRIRHEFQDNLEVFYGPNESGKTLLLEAILKLLAPDIDRELEAISRVPESPAGYLVVESTGEQTTLGDGNVLNDVVDISPRHLRNVFVIRDSDLALREEHDFYDSVTQQIGDLHTNEIEAIQSKLADRGRLTSVDGRRGLSKAQENDYAADVRGDVTALVAEMREYITEAKANETATVEREAVTVSTELARCRERLAEQEAAETLAEYETLSARLETYREAIEQQDASVDSEILEDLEDLRRGIADATADIEALETEREELHAERDTLRATRESVTAERQPLEDREPDVEALAESVASFRDATGDSPGQRSMRFAQGLAFIGLAVGGAAAILNASLVSGLLIAIGVSGVLWYAVQYRAQASIDRERKSLLHKARDAGFSVEEVSDIAPAIREYRDELDRLQRRQASLMNDIKVKSELIDEKEAKLDSLREERQRKKETKAELLREVGAGDVETYRRRVEQQEALTTERDQSAQSLEDTLGTPDTESPSPETRLDYWEAELAAMIEDVDEEVAAEQFDPNKLTMLRREREELEARIQEITDTLETHERRLRQFSDAIQELDTGPFVESPIRLQSYSVEGLEEVAGELEALVEQIDRDADIAREALAVFDEIKAEEEQKITDLFGDNSRAATVFESITEGRYSSVTYDTTKRKLQVHRDGDQPLTPEQLSHGTTEQLYLAARIGLADQLLNAEPGFFLMDDAFLPADRSRLRDGFDVLQELAADGWQIIYFTAKEEVGVDLVDTYGIPRREFDAL